MKQRNPVLLHVVLAAASILFLLPLAWLVSTALKPLADTMREPPVLWPAHPVWRNFHDAFVYGREQLGYIPFLVYARNTLVICVLTVSGTVASCSMAAYAFARLRWPGRDLFFVATLCTMMVPFPVTMVPVFGLFRHLGWIGTFRPLWVPSWFGSAFSIFLMRQFFLTIPRELSEAAMIDGSSEWRTFVHVILPLARPVLAVVALLTFMANWNDFLGPLIYLLRQNTFTLSLGLQFYQSQHGGTQWNLLMAACVIVIMPVIALFFVAQRQFIQGISVTGLKS